LNDSRFKNSVKAGLGYFLTSNPNEPVISIFHPDGCENHKLVSLLALTQDPRLKLEGFLGKKELVSFSPLPSKTDSD
jgi:hypothetical protein